MMNLQKTYRPVSILAALCLLTACETLPTNAFRLSETALATREMQSREFHAVSDTALMTASMAVLQDLGYAIDEIEKPLGVLSASKRADASNLMNGMSALAIDTVKCIVTFLLGCSGKHYGQVDDVQDIRLTLITRPQRDDRNDVSVRVTIQRIIWDVEGRLSEQETVTDNDVYVAFFDRLSKAIFLEQESM